MEWNTKNLVLTAVSVVLLGFAGFMFLRSSSKAELPTEYRIEGICLACKKPADKTQKLSARPPFECPACKQVSVYPWSFCRQCKNRFVPDLQRGGDGPPRLPVVPVCVLCKSTNCGAYDSLDPECKPVGDAPLPKWP